MSTIELYDYRRWREALKAPPSDEEEPEEVLAHLRILPEGGIVLEKPPNGHFADKYYG